MTELLPCPFCDGKELTMYKNVVECNKCKSLANNEIWNIRHSPWISDEIIKARFWAKVEITEYCWNWKAAINNNGYGNFHSSNIDETLSHRISYQIIYGKIEKNITVCHKCDNPICVNPSHLFLGTQSDNMIDKMKKKRHRIIGRVSKYSGVTWRNDSNKFRAIVTLNGKTHNIGSFEKEIDAAKAYDKFVYEKLNCIEMLNFPEDFMPLPEPSKE